MAQHESCLNLTYQQQLNAQQNKDYLVLKSMDDSQFINIAIFLFIMFAVIHIMVEQVRCKIRQTLNRHNPNRGLGLQVLLVAPSNVLLRKINLLTQGVTVRNISTNTNRSSRNGRRRTGGTASTNARSTNAAARNSTLNDNGSGRAVNDNAPKIVINEQEVKTPETAENVPLDSIPVVVDAQSPSTEKPNQQNTSIHSGESKIEDNAPTTSIVNRSLKPIDSKTLIKKQLTKNKSEEQVQSPTSEEETKENAEINVAGISDVVNEQ